MIFSSNLPGLNQGPLFFFALRDIEKDTAYMFNFSILVANYLASVLYPYYFAGCFFYSVFSYKRFVSF